MRKPTRFTAFIAFLPLASIRITPKPVTMKILFADASVRGAFVSGAPCRIRCEAQK